MLIVVAILAALLSAVGNATANVTQRAASRTIQVDLTFSARLLPTLMTMRLWRIGLLVSIATFFLQILALGLAPLAVVQPLLVIELPLTLLGAARFLGGTMLRRDWMGVVATAGGLAVLLAFLYPQGGAQQPRTGVWIVATAATAALIVALGLSARGATGPTRSALLGATTGVTFGLSAAFMKGMTAAYADGLGGVVTAWETYAAVATAGIGAWLYQASIHSGRLVVTQPGITLLDPVVAILLGILVFDEQVSGGIAAVIGILGGAIMGAGVLTLGFSPTLHASAVPGTGPARES